MLARRLLYVAAVIAASASPRAQRGDDFVLRVGDWVHDFVERFANVVAEEEYVPALRSLGSRLRSEYLLVRYPGSKERWQTFRDVVAVDGNSLKNQPERLTKLFLQPFESVAAQANAITAHSARYLSPLSDPLLGIAVMQRQYQPRFKFVVGEFDRGLGLGVRRIKFDEIGSPTILRDGGGNDVPTHGTVWAIEATGRIVRTELHIGVVGRLTRTVVLTTAFKKDEVLQIDVPATMVDGYTLRDSAGVKGTAYYTRFRRFSVHTTEAIDTPKP